MPVLLSYHVPQACPVCSLSHSQSLLPALLLLFQLSFWAQAAMHVFVTELCTLVGGYLADKFFALNLNGLLSTFSVSKEAIVIH